jgi:hypothetical protein
MSEPDWKEQIRALKRLKNLSQGDMEQLLRGLDDALQRACGIPMKPIWRRRNRPPALLSIALLHDFAEAMRAAGLPTSRWVDQVHSERRSLWEEIGHVMLAEARQRGARVQRPVRLRRLLKNASEVVVQK